MTRRLSPRISSADSMLMALQHIGTAAREYVLHIRRPKFDFSTGNIQEPNLLISDDQKATLLAEQIDTRLLKARSVKVLVLLRDGGSVLLNLTDRTSYSIIPSTESDELCQTVNEILQEKQKSWWTAGSPGPLAVITLWLPILAFLTASFFIFSDPIQRAALSDPSIEAPPASSPEYIGVTMRILFWVWIAGIILVLPSIGLIRLRSGPLRIWPKEFTVKSMFDALHRFGTGDSFRLHIWGFAKGFLLIAGTAIATVLATNWWGQQ